MRPGAAVTFRVRVASSPVEAASLQHRRDLVQVAETRL